MRATAWFIAVGVWLGAVESGEAYFYEIPESVAPVILSETDPFVFTPNDFHTDDYQLKWVSNRLPGVEVSFARESLQWVRISKFFVLPRAAVMVRAKGVKRGRVTNAQHTQPMWVKDGYGTVQLPVAMVSGPKNPITIRIWRGGRELTGKVVLQFRPRPSSQKAVLYDTSCSPYNVRVTRGEIPRNSWLYLGCRFSRVRGDQHPVPVLELFAFWDGVGQSIEVDGARTPAPSVSVWPLRLRSRPGKVRLRAKGKEVEIAYGIPPRLRKAYLGAGVGPYAYTFNGGQNDENALVPLVTLYGSYFLSEQMRLVMFDATSIQRKYFTDFGFYLHIEQVRAFDERFSVNLLLGAHVLGFKHADTTYARFSAPQGFEFVFRDFILRRYNISAGAFVHPLINGRAYINTWLRWGKAAWFIEYNYIAWQEELHGAQLYNRSNGISFGFPIGRFF